MPRSKMDSQLRSFRLPRDLWEVLEKDSKEKGVSMNSLVTSILTRYAEWDRYADRFGYVSMPRTGLRSIHDALSTPEHERLARETGGQNPREATLFWFKRVDLDRFLRYLALYCRYGKLAECEVERGPTETTVLLHHSLGEKYARWQVLWISEAVKSITGSYPKCEAGVNSVLVRIPTPPAPANAGEARKNVTGRLRN